MGYVKMISYSYSILAVPMQLRVYIIGQYEPKLCGNIGCSHVKHADRAGKDVCIQPGVPSVGTLIGICD